jgi:hypothetical protein
MRTGLDSFGLYLPAAETGYFAARAALALVLGACCGRAWPRLSTTSPTTQGLGMGTALFTGQAAEVTEGTWQPSTTSTWR